MNKELRLRNIEIYEFNAVNCINLARDWSLKSLKKLEAYGTFLRTLICRNIRRRLNQ